jgi:Mor family transcriptional regulator
MSNITELKAKLFDINNDIAAVQQQAKNAIDKYQEDGQVILKELQAAIDEDIKEEKK